MTNAQPLLILTCAACGADMLRAIASGLMLTDGAVVVARGFTQQCGACGHVHEAGTLLVMRARRVV